PVRGAGIFLSRFYVAGPATGGGGQCGVDHVRSLFNDPLPQTLVGSHGGYSLWLIPGHSGTALPLNLGRRTGACRRGPEHGCGRALAQIRFAPGVVAVLDAWLSNPCGPGWPATPERV